MDDKENLPKHNKEVFDTELYVIGEALEIALKNERVRRGASRWKTDPP